MKIFEFWPGGTILNLDHVLAVGDCYEGTLFSFSTRQGKFNSVPQDLVYQHHIDIMQINEQQFVRWSFYTRNGTAEEAAQFKQRLLDYWRNNDTQAPPTQIDLGTKV